MARLIKRKVVRFRVTLKDSLGLKILNLTEDIKGNEATIRCETSESTTEEELKDEIIQQFKNCGVIVDKIIAL